MPLSALLEANCHPLLNRYLLRDVPESPTSEIHDPWDKSNATSRIDLYIPPPPMSDRKQALDFHLAMRNLFAWICRRSVVGQHLGKALVELMNSMHEFRSPGVDNVGDLISYLDEEGYLDMANQPIHGMAMLHLGEFFQIRSLYIDAFAHCAGMADCLYMLPEYQVRPCRTPCPDAAAYMPQSVTSLTRKLLRRAQADIENRLSDAGMALRNFLEEDLSEANLGLSAGGRAHLERFRTFLHAFYTHRLGYYPPSPVHTRSNMWEPTIYQRMRDDFEALYELLVDRSFTSIDNVSVLGQGGICALQSVHTFDLRHKLKSLAHPLPLLPDAESPRESKRRSLFHMGNNKPNPKQRMAAHATLIRATNDDKHGIAKNPLVVAYKKFEEGSIFSPNRLDKNEKLSQVDARKIRWILVYSIYQTLRSCTEPPPEVRDISRVTYSLAVSTAHLPPWKETPQRTSSNIKGLKFSLGTSTPSPPSAESTLHSQEVRSEIRPDVDYFALSLRDSSQQLSMKSGQPAIPVRSTSLSRAFARSGSLRKSVKKVKSCVMAPSIEPAPASRRSVMFHEIIVRGYGNGTNEAHEIDVSAELKDAAAATVASRSPSTASNSSTESSTSSAASTPCSEGSWSSGGTSIPEVAPDHHKPTSTSGHQRRASTSSSIYSQEEEPCPPVPRRSSARRSSVIPLEDHAEPGLVPAPLRRLPFNDPDEWSRIENEVHGRYEAVSIRDRRSWASWDEVPEWDSFADVGGLTALPPVQG